jgi:nucleotide-binding universal stress UspA family protein
MKGQVVFFPCDFSDLAEHALRELVAMAGSEVEELIIFHVTNRKEDKGLIRQKGPDEQFTDFKSKIPALEKVKHHFEWVHGISHDKIIERAHDIQIDWLVMGSKGAKGFDQLWGSRSEKIIRETSMPALLIPPKAHLNPINKISIASDFQSEILSGQLIPILELVDITHAALDVVSINVAHKNLNMQQRISKRHLKNRIRHFSPSFNTHFNKGSVSHGLTEYCKENAVDMLCIQTGSASGISRLLHESVSQDMLLQTQLPLVIFK